MWTFNEETKPVLEQESKPPSSNIFFFILKSMFLMKKMIGQIFSVPCHQIILLNQ